MGNTMFQFAFAHAASQRLGTSFVFGPTPLWEQFELGAWARTVVRAKRKVEFRARYGREPKDRVFVESDSKPAEVVRGLRDGVAYGGFFQSEEYFAGYEDDIRGLFAVRSQHEQLFRRNYGGLGHYICMHVRRGDYKHEPGWTLPTAYFLDALERVGDRDELPLIVVSDDAAGVRRELAEIGKFDIVENPPMLDFLLLMNASVVITSNSSFSWWAAWLNVRPGVKVLAPEHWLGFADAVERPREVIPKRWTTVPVRDGRLTAG